LFVLGYIRTILNKFPKIEKVVYKFLIFDLKILIWTNREMFLNTVEFIYNEQACIEIRLITK
jgi:hypothetical protein